MTTAFREEALDLGPKIDFVNPKLGIWESRPLPPPYRRQVKAIGLGSVFKIESQLYALRTGLQSVRLTRCEGYAKRQILNQQQTC